MAKLDGIYKCMICGNVAEVLTDGGVNMKCSGQDMALMDENTEDAATEKHVPLDENNEGNVIVKVGEVPHPMEEKHYIQMIELIKDGKVIASKRLFPGQEPVAEFCLDDTEGITARILCNIHGVWKNQ